jgi:hypothetical protein
MEHISAMGIATASVRRLTPMKLNTMTGGPPDVTPTINTPLKAVHDVTMLKLKPIIPNRPKVRLSSCS